MNIDISDSVAIYSRKSKFTDKGESVENQIEICCQYINIHYPDIADKNIKSYEDEGYSVKNMQHPQFKK